MNYHCPSNPVHRTSPTLDDGIDPLDGFEQQLTLLLLLAVRMVVVPVHLLMH